VQLACLEPIARGLHVTHWSSQDVARQAVAEGIVSAISARTMRRLLQEVDLQPHRTRYWKTAHLDAQFKHRAEQILWCYANANRLMHKGFLIVCVDEMPNLQALERTPIRRAVPGSIEQQEPARRHFSRNPTGHPSLPRERKIGDDDCLRRPAPSCVRYATALRAAP
jgi:hypothetical protein